MSTAQLQSAKDFDDTPQGMQKLWLTELKAGRKAALKWNEAGKRITKVFLDERSNDITASIRTTRLNLFSANVITLRSMLFGNVPRVEVSRRYEDANDDVARVAAELLERIANADIGKQFSYAIGQALDDRLLVGLGCARVRYDTQFESVQVEAILDEAGNELAPAYTEDRKTFEAAPLDYINWRDVCWSPARTWDEVRWIGFRNYLTRDQCVERFGEKIGENIPLGGINRRSDKDKLSGIEEDPWQKAEVWEIWCLEHKKVYWISEGMEVICDAKDDPLGLEAFFPCPQFMIANVTSQNYVPRADYVLAQDQYDELNQVTSRITILQRAIKVVGVYDKGAEGVQRMLTEAFDNDLIPVDNWAMFAEKGGIKGQIDWLPIEAVASALSILQAYRAELINLLYQITGMSDILRGSTQSGETATAQSIKAKFASTRVQAQQDDFARFSTDLQRLRIEVMAKHFDDANLLKQSNMEKSADADYIPQALQLIRSLNVFAISIKSEALAMQDMAAMRSEKTEFISGLSTFLGAAQPLIDKYPAAAPTLLEMLKWTMTGYKGASSIEGVLDKAIANLQQNPPPPAGDPKQAEQQAKQAESQAKVQGDVTKIKVQTQADAQRTQQELQADLVRQNAQTQGKIKEQVAQQLFSEEAQQRTMGMEAAGNVGFKRPQQ